MTENLGSVAGEHVPGWMDLHVLRTWFRDGSETSAGPSLGLREAQTPSSWLLCFGTLEQEFQTGGLWARWEPQMCFVGHKVFKRKVNQLPMFLSMFVHSLRKGDCGLTMC